MGVKGFSKTFTPELTSFKKLKGLSVSVDASVYMYKAALGANSMHTLTDAEGNPTIHLSVILAKVLNLTLCGIKQVWVFDYHEAGYSPPDKELELAIRQKKRDLAKKKLDELKEKKEKSDDMFSSDDDDEAKKCSLEKRCFTITSDIVNECKFVLDCLGVTWITAPKWSEAEHACAEMTNKSICDAVLSTDIDSLIYGAKKLVREVTVKRKRVLQLYDLNDILTDNDLTMKSLRKIAVILGTDHAPKTPGIGPGTALKKQSNVILTEKQEHAIKVFEKECVLPTVEMGEVGQNRESIMKLLDWMSELKGFNRKKLITKIQKVYKGDLV